MTDPNPRPGSAEPPPSLPSAAASTRPPPPVSLLTGRDRTQRGSEALFSRPPITLMSSRRAKAFRSATDRLLRLFILSTRTRIRHTVFLFAPFRHLSTSSTWARSDALLTGGFGLAGKPAQYSQLIPSRVWLWLRVRCSFAPARLFGASIISPPSGHTVSAVLRLATSPPSSISGCFTSLMPRASFFCAHSLFASSVLPYLLLVIPLGSFPSVSSRFNLRSTRVLHFASAISNLWCCSLGHRPSRYLSYCVFSFLAVSLLHVHFVAYWIGRKVVAATLPDHDGVYASPRTVHA